MIDAERAQMGRNRQTERSGPDDDDFGLRHRLLLMRTKETPILRSPLYDAGWGRQVYLTCHRTNCLEESVPDNYCRLSKLCKRGAHVVTVDVVVMTSSGKLRQE